LGTRAVEQSEGIARFTQRISAADGTSKAVIHPVHGEVHQISLIRNRPTIPPKLSSKKSDIEGVVGEFRLFLENAVNRDGKGQSTILEIK
jgi:hypothetical protein